MKVGRIIKQVPAWFRHGGGPRWIVLGIIVGIVSGLGAAGFFYLLEVSKQFTMGYLAGYDLGVPYGERLESLARWQITTPFRKWLFFIFPAVGGLLSGIIVYSLAPEAEGHGTDAMIDAFHNQDGRVRTRVPFVKSVATIITLATGGSAGREGPIAQIGAGMGVFIANLLGLSARDRRLILLAGTGGGLGAIFRAPLGGAITACEVIYREDLETDALIPTLISSITAYTIFSAFYGFNPIFHIERLTFHEPKQLFFYAILGLVCFPLGVLYIKTFYFLRDRVFRRMKIPNHFKPMIGGLGVGIIGLYFPQAYAGGWGHIQLALLGKMALETMAIMIFLKILATSLTIGSGGSGGVFGPTLFIGGMIGGVVGLLAHKYAYNTVSVIDARAFVLVGMAAFFAGVAHAPLGALLMVTEMTGGYHLIAPLLLVTAIAIIFSRKYSIYEKQVQNKFQSPAHVGEFTVNVLEEMTVADVFERKEWIRQIPANATYPEVLQHLAYDYEETQIWPVVKEDGSIIGVLSLDTTRPILFEDGMESILIASDLAIPTIYLHPGDSLYQALLEFLKYPIAGLLVTDPDDPKKILGILHHRDLIQAYNNEIISRKGASAL